MIVRLLQLASVKIYRELFLEKIIIRMIEITYITLMRNVPKW